MLKHPYIFAVLATCYLVAFVVMLHLNILPNVTMIMFFISPAMVIALAYSVIRFGKYVGPELQDDEHWGYQDRQPK